MIGALRHRITFQESVRVPDGGGGFTETWQNIAAAPEVYAALQPLSGSEQQRFYQLETTVTHRIIVRGREDITPALRIVRGAEVYDIISVTAREEAGSYLEILAVVRRP